MYTNKNVRGRSYVLYFLTLFISLVTLFGAAYLISKTPDIQMIKALASIAEAIIYLNAASMV